MPIVGTPISGSGGGYYVIKADVLDEISQPDVAGALWLKSYLWQHHDLRLTTQPAQQIDSGRSGIYF